MAGRRYHGVRLQERVRGQRQTNLVDVYIQRIRKKVDHGYDKKLIETVRGVGYRMAGGQT